MTLSLADGGNTACASENPVSAAAVTTVIEHTDQLDRVHCSRPLPRASPLLEAFTMRYLRAWLHRLLQERNAVNLVVAEPVVSQHQFQERSQPQHCQTNKLFSKVLHVLEPRLTTSSAAVLKASASY